MNKRHFLAASALAGGLGPQWAVLDVDRVAPFKDLPLRQRFAACPWGLYHVAVAGA